MAGPTSHDTSSWLYDILSTKNLLSRAALRNRLASRCLEVFDRFCSSIFDISQPGEFMETPEFFDGAFSAYATDQFGSTDFWDWSNMVFQ
jgi:hypothetical protein